MLPVNDFIFSNPNWADLPIRTVLGVLFLILFLVALRRGFNGAVELVSHLRWYFAVALMAAAVWGLYAHSILSPVTGWAG